MHYFYASYPNTITAPKESPQISIFLVKQFKTIYWSCFTMHVHGISQQLNTIICVATYITDHILVIIDQQRHDDHGRLYLRKWRLQLSIGKRVSAACHLNNRDAKRELDVFVDNKRLVFQQDPKYLGVRLDRMLTSSNTLKKWQERLNIESHSSVVLLVQPVEPLPKHFASPGIPCS